MLEILNDLAPEQTFCYAVNETEQSDRPVYTQKKLSCIFILFSIAINRQFLTEAGAF